MDSKLFLAQPAEEAPTSILFPWYLSIGLLSIWERKKRVDRGEISDDIGLFEAATEILNGISDAELQRVFRSWIKRIKRVIDAGGDYLAD